MSRNGWVKVALMLSLGVVACGEVEEPATHTEDAVEVESQSLSGVGAANASDGARLEWGVYASGTLSRLNSYDYYFLEGVAQTAYHIRAVNRRGAPLRLALYNYEFDRARLIATSDACPSDETNVGAACLEGHLPPSEEDTYVVLLTTPRSLARAEERTYNVLASPAEP